MQSRHDGGGPASAPPATHPRPVTVPAIRAAKGSDKTALQRLRAVVEDFRGAFGWATPLVKGVAAACVPAVAALIK